MVRNLYFLAIFGMGSLLHSGYPCLLFGWIYADLQHGNISIFVLSHDVLGNLPSLIYWHDSFWFLLDSSFVVICSYAFQDEVTNGTYLPRWVKSLYAYYVYLSFYSYLDSRSTAMLISSASYCGFAWALCWFVMVFSLCFRSIKVELLWLC